MQLNRFDLNLMIALDALLRERNVTRAAERVFVSQPAMSAALHKLREYFNDPLLVRVGREMELTPRGVSLVEPVREALLRIQLLLGTQPTFDPKPARREFTVIMSEEAVPGVLPALLRTLSLEAPELDLHIEMISPAALSRRRSSFSVHIERSWATGRSLNSLASSTFSRLGARSSARGLRMENAALFAARPSTWPCWPSPTGSSAH